MAEKLDLASVGTVPGIIPLREPQQESGYLSRLADNPVGNLIRDAYLSFSVRRASLGLSNPGSVEGISREVTRDVFLRNHMFSGFRAEFSKAFSNSPLFQTAHNFTMGADGMPPYSFAALYGSPKVFLQGGLDNDLSLQARANYRWTSAFVTKANVQLAAPAAGMAQSMVQLEADYVGADFTANLKTMNPSILDGNTLTGICVGSYFQSITPSLALGFEAMWQRPSSDDGPNTLVSYAARYKGNGWIGSAQVLAQGGIQASYWRRLAERVEAGVDVNLQLLGLSGAGGGMMGMPSNEGTATMGVKYDFRTSVFRGQIDSSGKVAAVIEKRIAPQSPVQLTFAGEMDHSKSTAKLGMAVSIEGVGSEELMEQQQMPAADVVPPPF